MKVKIIKRAILPEVPSASGVEIVDGIIYIIGDNSPYLFKLDQSLKVLEKVELFKVDDTFNGYMPKAVKPDIESMSTIIINNYKHLLVFGSGSKSPYRDAGFLIKLPTSYNRKHIVFPVEVKELYNLLRRNDEIVGNGQLNLEGAAASSENFILLNRASGGSKNVALYFDLAEFTEFVQGHMDTIPFPIVNEYELPSLRGVGAGFTGADFYEDKLFFTATVENTSNAIDDGEVFGSFVGWMEMKKVDNMKGVLGRRNDIKGCAQIEDDGKPYLGKVESISIFEKEDNNTYIAIAVSDNDGKPSEILMLELTL